MSEEIVPSPGTTPDNLCADAGAPAPRSPLQDLLERVKAATGPDRELDAAIFNSLIDDAGRVAFRVSDWTRGRAPMLDRYHDGWLIGKSDKDIYANDLVRFTASLDAALALVERVLLGADWRLQTAPDGRPGFTAVLIHLQIRRMADGKTPTLALLAALLSALIAGAPQ